MGDTGGTGDTGDANKQKQKNRWLSCATDVAS